MSEKDCGHEEEEEQILFRRILIAILALIVVVLFIVFLVWIILRPTKPRFILQDAAVFAFNVSAPSFLTSNLQVTLASENPNARVGVYYDHVDVYASYRGQQITLSTLLPPSYQGHKDLTVWSPILYGAVPIAPYLGDSLYQDQIAGRAMIHIRVHGQIRWKVGTFISGPYHLDVSCPAYVSLGNNNNNGNGNNWIPIGPTVKFQLMQSCNVDV